LLTNLYSGPVFAQHIKVWPSWWRSGALASSCARSSSSGERRAACL
jgi:hypothetical protein